LTLDPPQSPFQLACSQWAGMFGRLERMLIALSEQDVAKWAAALRCIPTHADDWVAWVEGPVRAFFPFQRLFMACGVLVAGEIQLQHVRASGHGADYLVQLAKTFELRQRGSIAWWLTNRQPFYIDPSNPAPFVSPFELDEIRTFNLVNVAGHGVLNPAANAGTYFGFSGVSTPPGQWHLDALRLVVPILSDLLTQDAANHARRPPDVEQLTPRQLAIVRELNMGANDKTIAKRLGISEKTVRNQLSLVYAKLNVHKRAALIALMK
jgi:DNA-binding CsgD family transcriptional regulator